MCACPRSTRIPRRWTAGWRCLNLPAPSRKRKRAIDGTGWRWAQTSACASTAVSYTHLDVYKRQQQGIEQGEQQTAERIARAMLANGLDLSLVAKLTGLAPECLARLQH